MAEGRVISPLLANIYLHYVFDLWAERWRRREARGTVILVRYADDIVAGFERKDDAERFRADMRARLAQFALTLHPDKTRLIEFGRFAAANRRRRGQDKPETFDFLGFTHIAGRSRRGHFLLLRRSRRDRKRGRLKAIKDELRRRMHDPIPAQGRWLRQVVVGYLAYHAVPTNGATLAAFRYHVQQIWMRARSLAPQTAHPAPLAGPTLRRQIPEVGAGCGKSARPVLCGGCPVMGIPTAISPALASLRSGLPGKGRCSGA
jgi:RNA-directed DNA polymerase